MQHKVNTMAKQYSRTQRIGDQIQRELASLTGETRLSAWVLTLLPSGIAAYMVAVNPDYIMSMWNDDGGRMALLTALGFQLVGAFILWRMVKSV